ncbi:DUF4169 family protein [Bartonella alsatica]|uniref:DUF4169 domain-containing protein n=2 Tax=Bartonella alsatica TaxID=52764 RepID=J0PT64_9HYPH|nr:DUF4169 family protein [Bartonella alsatica]EJF75721.1 hypothetical protein MEC_00276 [Bartonella alsatica IBS 382]QLC51619.1 DUF4169 family protein [Bartonella alsatica]
MTEPINLRQFRKQKKRVEKTIHAEENRYRFGRTKTEKLFEKKEALKVQKFLDQNRLSFDE